MNKRWQRLVLLSIGILAFMIVLVPTLRAAQRPKVTIEMGSGKMGSNGYLIIHATTDLINKHSSWLRAVFVETTGITENLKTLAEEPEKRKSFACYSELFTVHQAAIGAPPFNKPYTTNRIIARMVINPTVILTLDPKIRTVKDLIGKKLAVGPKGISTYWHTRVILRDGYGIWDEIKPEYLGFEQGKNALINGLIDATIEGSGVMKSGPTPDKPEVVIPAPAGMELKDMKKPYAVPYDKEAIAKAREKSGYPLFWVEVPAETWGPNQPKPFGGEMSIMTWSCDLAMPDDVVYEITRIIYENADKFKNYLLVGKSINKEDLANIPGTTEKDFHPGAVKFYKEHGIKIGAPAS